MKDIEFNCPSCDTALVVAAEGAGKMIHCPNCAKSVEVPGRRRVDLVEMSPPIASGHRQDYRDYDIGLTLRTRNCTLAYVSLALVCLSILTAGLLLLPGIICGHIAISQCDHDRNLTGRIYAVAALIVGYIIVGVVAVIVIGLIGVISSST